MPNRFTSYIVAFAQIICLSANPSFAQDAAPQQPTPVTPAAPPTPTKPPSTPTTVPALPPSATKDLSSRVLDPAQFFGPAAVAYSAAKQIPQILQGLFCYAGDDVTDGHTSLLDCFTSTHAVDEPVCQWEALMAFKLFKEGKSLPEIQKAVDAAFETKYPFREPSPALRAYRNRRDHYSSGRTYTIDPREKKNHSPDFSRPQVEKFLQNQSDVMNGYDAVHHLRKKRIRLCP